MKYKPTIGLEIHAELNTKSKMFCSCPNDPNEKHPNFNVCPVCMGHPGTLPVINEEAVKRVIKAGLALNCHILENSKFDRKNYFYPDLPKGYQISQYDMPLCEKGYLELESDGGRQKIRIARIHLEEDTGRLLHPEGADYSLIDFNRAGIPLMELVTEPDIHSTKEARVFAQEFQLILRYIGISNADMEKGQMRVEANISIAPEGELGTKVEVKNLNSFRAVEKAIEYEIVRQAEILDAGKKVIQETRGWYDIKQITFSQRGKEEAHDYRYFPEPDLPVLRTSEDYIKELKAELPELPQSRRERFASEYNLLPKETETFVVQKELGEYFEKVISELKNWIEEAERKDKLTESEQAHLIKLATNYILSDLLGFLKEKSITSEDFLISPENFAEFITLIYEDKISSKMAKDVLAKMFKTGEDPHHIIEEGHFVQLTDEDEIEKIIKEIISQNPKAIEDYKNGKANALQFLIGKAMIQTKGLARPEIVRELFIKLARD